MIFPIGTQKNLIYLQTEMLHYSNNKYITMVVISKSMVIPKLWTDNI